MSHPGHNSVTPAIYGCGMAKASVQRKGTVWSFVVDLGPDPATGRRRQARRSGFTTKKSAEAALRSLATTSDAGTARNRTTVSGFLTEWLETMRPHIRETTWVRGTASDCVWSGPRLRTFGRTRATSSSRTTSASRFTRTVFRSRSTGLSATQDSRGAACTTFATATRRSL